MKSTSIILLGLSMIFLFTTGYQALLAERLAIETTQTYAPRAESQIVAVIIEALPATMKGDQAGYLARGLAANVDSQYEALSRAVLSQARTLTQQTVAWAVISVISMFLCFESRRKITPSAA